MNSALPTLAKGKAAVAAKTRGLGVVLLCFATLACAQKFTSLYPTEGLRDYEKQPAFVADEPAATNALAALVSDLRPSAKSCTTGRVKAFGQLKSNVCDQQQLRALGKLVHALAPSLPTERLFFWVADLDGAAPPALLVGHVDLNKEEAPHPFLSLWRLRFHAPGVYRATYAGPFLQGHIHAIREFGADAKAKAVFVKHLNCLECEPTTFLTALHFAVEKTARAFHFSYAEKHDEFAPIIEYEYPGMGNTVEAVYTRTLPPSAAGPHLLQFFKDEKGGSEWWSFKCVDYRCDYELFKGSPPAAFRRLWKSAKPL